MSAFFDRYASRIMTEPNSGCWIWIGPQEWNGYGRFTQDGKRFRVHRLAWENSVGPIPGGLMVCHTCDVRSCVNPDHLFLGTAQDNAIDCTKKGKNVAQAQRELLARGERHGSAKLTPDQVIAIRFDDRGQEDISADFGIHRGTVSRIKSRKLWVHI